ncbi:unannotated protein [freshwater metagenome]|uniref:Unannotated protein n=1 Tax=freshwater metagenome TaxID=449393 RepID=A0A6J7J4Y0_9ZZZZ
MTVPGCSTSTTSFQPPVTGSLATRRASPPTISKPGAIARSPFATGKKNSSRPTGSVRVCVRSGPATSWCCPSSVVAGRHVTCGRTWAVPVVSFSTTNR